MMNSKIQKIILAAILAVCMSLSSGHTLLVRNNATEDALSKRLVRGKGFHDNRLIIVQPMNIDMYSLIFGDHCVM